MQLCFHRDTLLAFILGNNVFSMYKTALYCINIWWTSLHSILPTCMLYLVSKMQPCAPLTSRLVPIYGWSCLGASASASSCAYTKIGTIQRRLAWPLRKDDTQIREAFHIFFYKWLIHFFIEKERNSDPMLLQNYWFRWWCRSLKSSAPVA